MGLTIDDLLNSLRNPNEEEITTNGTLENNKETWRRIAEKDSFEELGLDSGKLESFLKEWIDQNPYNNI